ncbi:MAG: hypothetical protein ACOCXP_04305 [Candidatus Dojkabacteria bacterium]
MQTYHAFVRTYAEKRIEISTKDYIDNAYPTIVKSLASTPYWFLYLDYTCGGNTPTSEAAFPYYVGTKTYDLYGKTVARFRSRAIAEGEHNMLVTYADFIENLPKFLSQTKAFEPKAQEEIHRWLGLEDPREKDLTTKGQTRSNTGRYWAGREEIKSGN